MPFTDPKSYFIGGKIWGAGAATRNLVASDTANRVYVSKFFLPFNQNIGHMTTRPNNGIAASTFNIGLYDTNGNLIFDSGSQSGAVAATVTVSFTQILLLSRWLYLAWGVNNPLLQFVGYQEPSTIIDFFLNSVNLNDCYSSNPISAGCLPVNLGVLTPVTPNVAFMPVTIWEP